MADYNFYGFFTATKTGKTGLTVTCTVYGPGGTEASAQAATEVGGGLYKYTHADATAGDYIAVFATADTSVDSQHVPALATKQLTAYLDAQVSTLPALVWAVATSTLTGVGTIGKYVVDLLTAIPTAVWNVSVRTLTSFGTLIADIVAAISGGGTSTFSYTVTNSITGLPLEGVLVRVSTDIAGVNTIAAGETDSFGTVVFYLNPGTYYFWNSKDGFNFTNPDTEIVT